MRKLLTDPLRSSLMARVRQRGTAPELAVRAALRHLGLHYRLNARDLPGSPDIVHRGRKKAIFIHGCFWHRHSGCVRCTTPKRNSEFWLEKFERNVERDQRNVERLRKLGFDVLVVWECETFEMQSLLQRLRGFWAANCKERTR